MNAGVLEVVVSFHWCHLWVALCYYYSRVLSFSSLISLLSYSDWWQERDDPTTRSKPFLLLLVRFPRSVAEN